MFKLVPPLSFLSTIKCIPLSYRPVVLVQGSFKILSNFPDMLSVTLFELLRAIPALLPVPLWAKLIDDILRKITANKILFDHFITNNFKFNILQIKLIICLDYLMF